MDLNHIAGELAAKLVDNIECNIDLVNGTGDTSIKDGESLILAALETVQAEPEQRTLERAIEAPVLTAHSLGTPELSIYLAGVLAKESAIRALIDKPAPPDPLLAALARGDPNRLDLESVPSGWRFDQLCVLEGGTWEVVLERTGTAPYDADHPERRRIAEGPTPRSALRAAIALAEGAR